MSTPKKRKTFESFSGFVHRLSPLKQGKKSPYYTCVLQTSTEDDVGTQTIGFSNTKRNLLKEFELNQTQVTIMNASSEIDSSGKKKILIINSSTFTGSNSPMIYNPLCSYRKLTLSGVDEAQVGDTHYSVDGAVIKTFESQQSHVRNLEKRHIMIADGKDKCTLVLYGALCNAVNVGKSYTFQCVKLRSNDDDRFLCTTPDTDIVQLDRDIEFDTMLTTSAFATLDPVITGRVISVKKLKSFIICPCCSAQIDDYVDETVTCSSCNGMTLTEICQKDLSVTFSFKENNNDIKELTAFQQTLNAFFRNEEAFSSLQEATKTLLRAGQLALAYNKISSNVISFGHKD